MLSSCPLSDTVCASSSINLLKLGCKHSLSWRATSRMAPWSFKLKVALISSTSHSAWHGVNPGAAVLISAWRLLICRAHLNSVSSLSVLLGFIDLENRQECLTLIDAEEEMQVASHLWVGNCAKGEIKNQHTELGAGPMIEFLARIPEGLGSIYSTIRRET